MKAAKTTRVKLRIRGLVQGVFYRGNTQEHARRLGLTGWVRNCVDGSVEVEAEGPQQAVDTLTQWCRRGPPMARVQSVDVEQLTPTGDESPFTIRY